MLSSAVRMFPSQQSMLVIVCFQVNKVKYFHDMLQTYKKVLAVYITGHVDENIAVTVHAAENDSN